MRIVILLLLTAGKISFGQPGDRVAMIAQPIGNVLFWNIENFVEFQSAEQYDSTWLYSKDCDFVARNAYSGYLIPRSNIRNCSVAIMGLRGRDTIRETGFDFYISRLPIPEVRLGYNCRLKSDLENYNDSSLFVHRYFTVGYEDWLRRLVDKHPNGLHFKIIYWQIKVGNDTLFGVDMKLNAELISAIENAPINTIIRFEFFNILMPDGREIRIDINEVYSKTTPEGTKLPESKSNVLYPTED